MNVGQANQKPLNTIEYLSLGLMRKRLTSHSDNSVVQAVRAEAIRNLKGFQCLICLDVQERILQTRCCDAILCADCYLNIQQPAKCPDDSAPFCGEMVRDLKLASPLVNSQIDGLLDHFADIPAKTLWDDLGKCRAQRDAIRKLQEEGRTEESKPPSVETPVHGAVAPDAVLGAAHNNPGPFAQVRVDDGTTIGRIIEGNNIVVQNGRVISGQNVQVTGIPAAIETHDSYSFPAAAIGTLNVLMHRGNLVIAPATAGEQDMIYVASPVRPKLNDRVLHIDTYDNVLVKLPLKFSGSVHLRTIMGNISTTAGYRINSGGSITVEIGNVDIKVNYWGVKPTGRSSMGRAWISRLVRPPAEWRRADLCINVRMGNINVTS